MKIKSTVWQWLAAGSFGAGLLYALGIEGGAQVGGTISDGQFITAMGLILLAVLLMQIGFRVQAREERVKKRKGSGKTPSPFPSADAGCPRGAARAPSPFPSADAARKRSSLWEGAFLKGKVG